MRFRSLSALALVVLSVLALTASASGALTADGPKKLYIVQLIEPPAAGYEGGVAGIPATKPGKGKKFDSGTEAAKKYRGYLENRHEDVLDKVGAAEPVAEYTASFNGVAVELTEAQAELLRTSKSVLAVSENEYVELDTTSTPSFLGLDKPASQGGLWNVLGGVDKTGQGRGAGEDVIVGIVDSGIWPENPAFSARKVDGSNGNLYPHKVSGWYGTCQTGEAWTAADCNGKIIGARYFRDGYTDAQLREADFVSPRDHDGHGSHVASTAAGNFGVQATGDAASFGKLSGMAPRARIAVYKVCWPSCATVDTVAGIDAAVADGVDVLNYSISGTTTAFTNPVEVAFLFAAEAGVYVSASAGNAGTVSSVAHPSPWITTTAAGTHNRDGKGTLKVGAVTFNGASSAVSAVTGTLINASSAGRAGADATQVNLCTPGTLDPAKVTGKIVVCDRGVIGRIDKSRAVKDAGGIGMVQTNPSPNSINADLHFVPSIHLQSTDRDAVRALEGSSATISKGTIVYDAAAPFRASFSSQGPSLAAGGDILKPDIIAPGQDVMAAVAPPGNYGRDFDLYSGTSMSSPHMTGLGALLKQARPSWTPMMIKSAFMTTSYQSNDYNPFGWGAGHVDPNKAIDPGLVLDSGMGDWLAFLKGQGLYTGSGPSLRAFDLNTPSIAIARLAGDEQTKRTYTSVGSQSETYTVSFQGLTGVTPAASPSSFTAAPGSATEVTYTFTRTTAALNTYTTGFAVLTGDKGHVVKIPVVLRPVPLATPAEVTSTSNSASWTVKTGYDGPLNATVRGLVAATETPWTVAQDPDQTFALGDMTGTFKYTVNVPANTTFRTGIYEDAITPAGTDLDLFVYAGSTLAASSADGDSNEEVTIRRTAAITYDVYVHGWSTNGPSASGTLFTWLANANTGNVSLSGIAPATTAATQTHTATFSGLTAGKRYLGDVRYNDGAFVIGQTLLSVRP